MRASVIQQITVAVSLAAGFTAGADDIRLASVSDTRHNAFGRALDNLRPEHWSRMLEGKRVFVHRYSGGDGLGPLYNADACTTCHFKDGRGGRPSPRLAPHPPTIFRLEGTDLFRELGGQLQDRGLGVEPEGHVRVSYREEAGRYPDGAAYTLRRPEYQLVLGSPPQPAEAAGLSPRIPPTLVGMGFLEAVAASEVLAFADPDDSDADGISGRPAWAATPDGRLLGRFGWKAGQPSLEAQVTAALANDMGILTGGPSPEITPENLARLVDYLRLLSPPGRRAPDHDVVRRGEQTFHDAGCAGCHRPRLRTGGVDEIPGPPELASRWIHPYTDLLLHDMGEELADGAGSREWRTSPLWGLGLLEHVNGETFFLHDGRARTFEEAILWHGGEAAASRRRFMNLALSDRKSLITFLTSL